MVKDGGAMSIPKITELTPEQKEILCAVECGWQRSNYTSWISPAGKYEMNPLPYSTSLDAMAEAEKTLTDEEHFEFRTALAEQCARDCAAGTVRDYHRALKSRTPPQRLDAFLIAKGLATL